MAANKRYLLTAALGIFFGTGFLSGFFTGYQYAALNFVPEVSWSVIPETEVAEIDFDKIERFDVIERFDIFAIDDIGLVLEDYWIDSDDNGLYIAGAVRNSDDEAFDSVRVAFDLLDGYENAYSAVTVRNDERMEPGDIWDFTIYIPYSELDKFNSFRFQSVMGVKRY